MKHGHLFEVLHTYLPISFSVLGWNPGLHTQEANTRSERRFFLVSTHLLFYSFLYGLFMLLVTVTHRPASNSLLYLAKDVLELLILPSLPPNGWDHHSWFHEVLETDSRVVHLLGKYLTD